MDNDVSLPCLTLKTKFMKTIEISNETLHDNVCKTRLQNHIMKEKEYNSEEDVFLELKEAICEGMQSGIVEDFDPETYLKSLRQSFLPIYKF